MRLKLENFDGPLDLLLYLIKTQDLNIFDIPIAHITLQFLSFIRQTVELDIHQAGEYLSMAAQLIEIKTNTLLPTLQNKQISSAQNLDEMDENDPRKPLVEQLLEYESIKKASEELAQKSALLENRFPSGEPKRRSEEWNLFEHPIKGNPFDLTIIFEKILLQYSHIKTLPKVVVQTQKITIEHKMNEVMAKMRNTTSTLKLTELIVECESRYELIVILMAILELCQMHCLMLLQNGELEDIYLDRGKRFSMNFCKSDGEMTTNIN